MSRDSSPIEHGAMGGNGATRRRQKKRKLLHLGGGILREWKNKLTLGEVSEEGKKRGLGEIFRRIIQS